jgi:tyrosyl-tRNA synthetase
MVMFFSSRKVITDRDRVNELLSRNVEEVFIKESLEKKLLSGKVLRIKLGFDPTGPNVHIGRAIVLRKLRAFQELGHQAVFIVGDTTAKIGDPSDKLNKRPMLTDSDISKNLIKYKEQIGKIVDLSRAEFHYNSAWLKKLNFSQVAELAESFSVQQMSNRRNFKERIEKGEEVSLREFLYPLMQGYDSVAIKSDVELGGFDQLFNLKAGRIVQKHYGAPEQDVLTTEMLEGTDGRKMSTSWGNVINISDTPGDMYGKVMSIKDDLIGKYLYLCTDTPITEARQVSEDIKNNAINPKDAKMVLARKIVAIYHGEKKSQDAEKNFLSAFGGEEMPKDAPKVAVTKSSLLSDVLMKEGIVASKSEFRRLLSENAISVLKGDHIKDPFYKIEEGIDLRVGKKRFIKITLL